MAKGLHARLCMESFCLNGHTHHAVTEKVLKKYNTLRKDIFRLHRMKPDD